MRNLTSLFLVSSFAFLFACNGDAPANTAMSVPADEGRVVQLAPEPAAAPADAPATESPAQTAPASPGAGPLACDPADMGKCRTDADCACGSNLSAGGCAVGTAACIDTTKQCPDFCSGIDGRMTSKCVSGQCAQVHQ